jgi:hypothetical protein
MKPNLVTLAVFATLVSPAPAAAASTINLAVSSSNPVLGTLVTYTVSGEAEVTQMYEVRIMHVGLPSANCERARPAESIQVRAVEVQGKATSLIPFNYSATLPIEDYSELGTYAMCAIVREGRITTGGFSSSLTSFTVMAAPASEPTPQITPPQAPAPAPAPAPVMTPPPSVAPATPMVKPVKPVSKLSKALKLCKQQKKHSRRIAC